MGVSTLILELRHFLRTPFGLIICYVFTNSLAGSIWMSNAWTPFIFQMFGDSNIYVGLMALLNGVFELIFALLGGYLADRVIGPSQTLIIAVRFGVFALVFTAFSVWLGVVWVLMISQALYGTYLGLSLTSVESVFAQCVKKGERDRIYGVKFSLEASGPIGGLIISLVLFLSFGNSWRVDVLRWVITAGAMLHILSMLTFLLHFRPLPSCVDGPFNGPGALANPPSDVSPLDAQEVEVEPHSLCVEEELTAETHEKTGTPAVSPLPSVDCWNTDTRVSPAHHENCIGEGMKRGVEQRKFFLFFLDKYPYVVASANLVTTLGSGMTVRYFSLFMMSIYGVSPVGLSILGLLTSVLISVLAIVNMHIGRRIGRVRALFFPKFLGTFILLYMTLARETSAGPMWLMCAAYVLRMALMNSTTALSRALIMDTVAEGRRGMWNAVESLQSASWSGTALVGGVLADRVGYGAAFIVTFGFHLAACLMLLPCTLRNDTVMALGESVDDATHRKGQSVCEPNNGMQGDFISFSVEDVTMHDIVVAQEEFDQETNIS